MPSLAHSWREEGMGDLGQHAAAVAERRVRAGGAAMVEVDEDLQSLFQDRMRLAVLHVGDEADAAGVALVRGIVETLRARRQRIGSEPNRRQRRRPRPGRRSSVQPSRSSLTPPTGRICPAVARQVFR